MSNNVNVSDSLHLKIHYLKIKNNKIIKLQIKRLKFVIYTTVGLKKFIK